MKNVSETEFKEFIDSLDNVICNKEEHILHTLHEYRNIHGRLVAIWKEYTSENVFIIL